MKKLLLIGATDPNGAGLQADWRVCAQLGITACSVVTAVTAQNHDQLSDTGILPPEQIRAQLNSIDWAQIAAVKIGMLGSAEVVNTIYPFLENDIPLVLDPVLNASSGGSLLNPEGRQLLVDKLLPRCDLLTPNLAESIELAALTGKQPVQVQAIAQTLNNQGAKAVLLTGTGTRPSTHCSVDYFFSGQQSGWLKGRHWPERGNVRGTGCSLATTIACGLIKGQPMTEAIIIGIAVINAAIKDAVPDTGAWQMQTIRWPSDEAHLPLWTDHPENTAPAPQFPDCGSVNLGVYPVVDSVEWIKRLVPLGVETIQLRIKQADMMVLEDQVAEASAFCRHHRVRLFVNDHWQLAIKCHAYGVHLGQEDVQNANLEQISAAGLRLGLSTHCYREVSRALAVNPSYLALGPIYPTTSKQMPWIPQGAAAVRKWVALLDPSRPLVAIGGIDMERAKDLAETGVGSIAMISAITGAANPEQVTRELLEVWRNAMLRQRRLKEIPGA